MHHCVICGGRIPSGPLVNYGNKWIHAGCFNGWQALQRTDIDRIPFGAGRGVTLGHNPYKGE